MTLFRYIPDCAGERVCGCTLVCKSLNVHVCICMHICICILFACSSVCLHEVSTDIYVQVHMGLYVCMYVGEIITNL